MVKKKKKKGSTQEDASEEIATATLSLPKTEDDRKVYLSITLFHQHAPLNTCW